ncbi:MAG: hypothetical protein KAH56_06975 [Candidatus Krumholzibacteria bacterium]|nr:hypothetical protein [Candidatus Krumholzibacteria bacterium]
MSDDARTGSLGGGGRPITILAAVLVLALALGALLWPGVGPTRGRGVLLVFDSSGDQVRITNVYEPFLHFLNEFTDQPLDLAVVGTVGSFREKLIDGADFVFCPDGLGLTLEAGQYVPVAVGRRAAPRNLRPRGVLVFRKSAGLIKAPWLSRPEVTVCGDSVSLTATGAWRRKDVDAASESGTSNGCSWGPDPYDHAPALHAARLGGFDYALVRQWDADRFFSDGLLSPLEWGIELVTVPVPDIVIFASRSVAGKTRLAVGDGLVALGRGPEEQPPAAREVRRAIGGLNLAGFNLLVDPDFEFVRRNFAGNWPPTGD